MVSPYALIQNRVPNGTQGGTATAGDWEDLAFNYVAYDDGINVAISGTGTIILHGAPDGTTFHMRIRHQHGTCGSNQIRLWHETAGYFTDQGTTEDCTAGHWEYSLLDTFLTATGTVHIRAQGRVGTTRSTNGQGLANSFGVDEIYGDWTITV